MIRGYLYSVLCYLYSYLYCVFDKFCRILRCKKLQDTTFLFLFIRIFYSINQIKLKHNETSNFYTCSFYCFCC